MNIVGYSFIIKRTTRIKSKYDTYIYMQTDSNSVVQFDSLCLKLQLSLKSLGERVFNTLGRYVLFSLWNHSTVFSSNVIYPRYVWGHNFFKIPLSIPDSRKSPLYFKPPQSLHNIYIIIYILFYQTKTRFKSNEVIYSPKSLFKLCKLSNWNSVIWTHCHSCIIDVEFLSLSLLVHIFLENEVPILDRKVS